MKNSNEKRKISVRVWDPVLNKLNELTAAACLNRDAYLDIIFAKEASALQDEIAPDRNSETARLFIKKSLMELKDFSPVSLNLSVATIEAIQSSCTAVNVGRDSFINRILFLLVARPEAYEQHWGIKIKDHYQEIFDEGNDIKGLLLCAPLVAIKSMVNDEVFLGLRIALREAGPEKLHRAVLGRTRADTPKERGLVGLNVYLPDAFVPGTDAAQKQDAEIEAMFAEDLPEATKS